MDREQLPDGYFIIDTNHDGDAEDGRYGVYLGDFDDPENAEFLGNLHDLAELIKLAWVHADSDADSDSDAEHNTEYESKLADYQALKDAGEDYVECPRCEGSRTVSAILIENVHMAALYDDQMWRYSEDFPCPLCCTYGPDTIDVDKAIEWLQDKVDLGG